MRQNFFKRKCYGFAKFEFDPNDVRRRIAIIEQFLIVLSNKIEHFQVIILMTDSACKHLVGKITDLHYLRLCK